MKCGCDRHRQNITSLSVLTIGRRRSGPRGNNSGGERERGGGGGSGGGGGKMETQREGRGGQRAGRGQADFKPCSFESAPLT